MENKKPIPPTLTKDQFIRERWRRGKLGYKLHKGQLVVRERYRASRNQLFVGECARQFGKSYEMVVEGLELAFSQPKARIKYGTAFYTDLIEFIIPTFDTVLADCPDDLRPKWVAKGSKFVVPSTRSEIKLVGLDKNPNGLRGNVIDLIILDEAGFITNLDYLYKSVIIPATTHRPNCRIVLISTPPSTPAHPFLDYVEKAEVEDSYCKLTVFDNPMVGADTIVRLMRETGCVVPPDAIQIVQQMLANKTTIFPRDGRWHLSTTFRREYLVEHVTDSNLAIIPEWTMLGDQWTHEVAKDQYYPFYHKYTSMDLGVKDHTAALFGYYEFKKARLVIEDEYVINGPELTTEILQAAIQKKERELGWSEGVESGQNVPYLRVSDNNNPLLLQDLSVLHHLHFVGTDKGSLEEMINAVRLMVNQGRIIVHPRCKQLRGCLKYGVWDKKRHAFAHSKVYGHYDALAALVYLVRNLDMATNPIPPSFEVDRDNQILFSRQYDTEDTKELKRAFQLK